MGLPSSSMRGQLCELADLTPQLLSLEFLASGGCNVSLATLHRSGVVPLVILLGLKAMITDQEWSQSPRVL